MTTPNPQDEVDYWEPEPYDPDLPTPNGAVAEWWAGQPESAGPREGVTS